MRGYPHAPPSPFQHHYQQAAPQTYPTTSQLFIFKYDNISLPDIYKQLFKDYLIIGKTRFRAQQQNPQDVADFAKSIGADVLIVSSTYIESRDVLTTVMLFFRGLCAICTGLASPSNSCEVFQDYILHELSLYQRNSCIIIR